MRDDLINNHTCININSDSCNGLIIMGGIYFEAVIYFPILCNGNKTVLHLKDNVFYCPSSTHSCPNYRPRFFATKLQQKQCSSTNRRLNAS